MSTFYTVNDYRSCLMHHGVKGQKWGIRRYRNEDGSLTEEGRKHYQYGNVSISKSPYDDAPVPTMVVSDGRREIEVTDRSLYQLEQQGHDWVMQFFADSTYLPIEIIKDVVENEPDSRAAFDDMYEATMNMQLNQLLSAAGVETKGKRNK